MPVDLNDFKRFPTNCNGKTVYNKKYMGYCVQCNEQRGYIFKAEDGKLCKKCVQPKQTAILMANKDKGIKAAADFNRGRPAWNSGKKTGKPAWNRGTATKVHKILRDRVSRRLRHALSQRLISKNRNKAFDILGYDAATLEKHLESLFQPGMTWENRDEWEIDHVIPDSWFTYSSIDDADFKKSWCLENLQPMWTSDNCSKGSRYAGCYQEGK